MQKRNHVSWSKLDNAAKIFPCTSNNRDTKVFRFACELKEEVNKSILQEALEQTLEDIPVYRSVLKKGLFWYYLESSTIKPVVQLETKQPCSPLYHKNKKSLLFEVTYYHKRINLEVYHALSDGTGALQFLKTLVQYYIMKSHPEDFEEKTVSMDYDASSTQQKDDSFYKYYTENNKKFKVKMGPAYRVKQPRLSENRISVIEGKLPIADVLKKAHEHHVTLTVFIASLFMCAIEKEMALKDKKDPVTIVVPVNLRKYFYSETIRNFFGVINISYQFEKEEPDFEDVLNHIGKSMSEQLTVERLSERMNGLSALEHNMFARPVPLFLKDIIMREANRISEKERTASLSNIGKIDMPEELKPYIEGFDVFVSTNIIQICMCSYEENLTISFTSAYNGTDIQKNFFRSLTKMGIPVQIASNHINEI
jgi:NRPS condensation-like uncharacterized protein